ncbi:MAG TPA: xylulokinase [Candidatus Dormibacteraeota bacterium]|nr:xylulokinase [Candidatus Dormibacteraeota bacterium]
MRLLAGLDVGTGGVRAVVVDESGRVRAAATASYPLHQPRPGWTEQDPEDWWRGTEVALGRALEAAGGGEVVGLGLAGQMHGAVFLDAADRVLRPALLWNDQRTSAQCRRITELVGERRLLEVAGNPALTGFQAPKILWLRDEEPERFRRLARVLLPKDYVRLRLTGELATDASDASGTLLLDLRRRDWARPILEALEIPVDWLPPVREAPEPAGGVRAVVASSLGLRPGVPVAAGAGDNAAAAVGTGVVEPGRLSCSIGTSGVLFAPTAGLTPDPSGRVHAFCHAVPGAYHLMGVTLSAGGSLRWWRDLLRGAGGAGDYDRLTAAAAEVPVGADGLLFLPYLDGERTPHLDPLARGQFFGLTSRHTHAHLTRAVMEGALFALRDALQAMRSLGLEPAEVRATGGGSRHPLWLRLEADVLGLPVLRPLVDEGAAYGAALLAGVAAGVYRDLGEACSLVALRPEVVEPDPARVAAYERLHGLYRELYPATAGLAHRLASPIAGEGPAPPA